MQKCRSCGRLEFLTTQRCDTCGDSAWLPFDPERNANCKLYALSAAAVLFWVLVAVETYTGTSIASMVWQ